MQKFNICSVTVMLSGLTFFIFPCILDMFFQHVGYADTSKLPFRFQATEVDTTVIYCYQLAQIYFILHYSDRLMLRNVIARNIIVLYFESEICLYMKKKSECNFCKKGFNQGSFTFSFSIYSLETKILWLIFL